MKRILKTLALTIIGILVVVTLVLWAGSYTSLDHEYQYTSAAAALDIFDPADSNTTTPQLSLIEANEMTFRARTAGFGGDRGNVILLHGFPESSVMYEPMIPALAAAGFQVVAFDQRGYSPGARPAELSAYGIDQLVGDVFAVADAVGFETFHLVGHDWGAGVGWRLVFSEPQRVKTWSALSIPHMGAYSAAMQDDPDQQRRSEYVNFFRTPWLPEAVFAFNNFAMMKSAIYNVHTGETLSEYLALYAEPGALTATLNWYRASSLTGIGGDLTVATPTAFIWGNEDPVVGDRALALQQDYFDGNLWETELNTGHWLMETEAEAVTKAVLTHIERHL